MKTGRFAWRVTLGVTHNLPPDLQKTGRPGQRRHDRHARRRGVRRRHRRARFRAFDARTGKELWTFKLPAAAQATPMTYRGADGRQYVVITSTGGGFFGNPVTDDSVMAFAALPRAGTYGDGKRGWIRTPASHAVSRAASASMARGRVAADILEALDFRPRRSGRGAASRR